MKVELFKMFCPKCHNEVIRPQSRFCPHCGGTLAIPAIITCPRCGFAARSDTRFCTKCGQTLGVSTDIKGPALQDETIEMNALRNEAKQVNKIFTTQKIILLTIVLIVVAGLGGFVYAFMHGYIMDQESPQVTITSPTGDKSLTLNASGDTAREIIEIKAKDNRKLKKVDLLVNGVPVQSYDNFGSLIFNWETGKEGKYTFYAVAEDYCGNTSKSPPVVIEVKNSLTFSAGTTPYFQGQSAGGIPGRWSWTSQRPVYEQDLRGLSAWDLDIMRNEIFARHGWNFELQKFRNYFYSQSWYRPKQIIRDIKTTNDEVTREMTQLEKENAAKILEYQKANGLI